jgi:hypothetical protein
MYLSAMMMSPKSLFSLIKRKPLALRDEGVLRGTTLFDESAAAALLHHPYRSSGAVAVQAPQADSWFRLIACINIGYLPSARLVELRGLEPLTS